MPEIESFNIETHRLDFLEQLRERVDSAFSNRKKVKFISAGRTNIGSASRSGRQGSMLAEVHGNRKVNLGTMGEDEPHEVRIDNPHDYKELVEYSLGKILPPDEAKKEAEAILEHEFAHHVPGLGEQGLQIKYGVDFTEDIATGKVGITPSVNLSGSTRVGVVRKIFEGPAEKSPIDKIFLRKK